jgi:hypothetical protein
MGTNPQAEYQYAPQPRPKVGRRPLDLDQEQWLGNSLKKMIKKMIRTK